MSEQRAREILRETAGPYGRRSVRMQLPNHERLGRRVTDRNTHDALLRFAIEHTVREAVWRAEMFSTDAEHGLAAAHLVRYVPTPCGSCNPNRVQMTFMLSYVSRLSPGEPIIAVVTHDAQGHVVVDVALGGAQVHPRNALLAHVDGFEQPGPSGVVIGVVLSPNFIFRTYPSSAGAQRAPARGANPQRGPLPPGFIERRYPSSGPASVQSRPGGHH
jgi:hypothetical protein